MTKNIIIKTSVQKRFDSFMMHGRVLFFSAPCGFGKTVLADALLHGQNVLRQSAADPEMCIRDRIRCSWTAPELGCYRAETPELPALAEGRS